MEVEIWTGVRNYRSFWGFCVYLPSVYILYLFLLLASSHYSLLTFILCTSYNYLFVYYPFFNYSLSYFMHYLSYFNTHLLILVIFIHSSFIFLEKEKEGKNTKGMRKESWDGGSICFLLFYMTVSSLSFFFFFVSICSKISFLFPLSAITTLEQRSRDY